MASDEIPETVVVEIPIVAKAIMPPEQSPPLIVAYDIRDILAKIQLGVDSANSALALKADKADLEAAKQQLHKRIDHTDERIGVLEVSVARATGWRAGFLVAVGIGGGLITGLILRVIGVV